MLKGWAKVSGLLLLGLSMAAWAYRDPTQPPGEGYKLDMQTGSINIQAIYYNKRKPMVVIDKQFYYEGDQLGGATIIKITPTEVMMEGPGGAVKMTMGYPTVRKPVRQQGKK